MVLLLYVSGYGWTCMMQYGSVSADNPWLWNERAAVMRRMSAPQIGDTPKHLEIVRPGAEKNSGYVVDMTDGDYFSDILAQCTPRYWHYREVMEKHQ
jgi:hypothetical protein